MAGRASHPAGHCCHWSLHLEGQFETANLRRPNGPTLAPPAPPILPFSKTVKGKAYTDTTFSTRTSRRLNHSHTKTEHLGKRALCLRPHLWGDGAALRPTRQTDRRPARRLGRQGQACTRPCRTSPCKSVFRRGAGSRICRGAPPHRNGAASCQTLAHRHSLPRQPRPNLALNTLTRSSVVPAGRVVQNFYRFF